MFLAGSDQPTCGRLPSLPQLPIYLTKNLQVSLPSISQSLVVIQASLLTTNRCPSVLMSDSSRNLIEIQMLPRRIDPRIEWQLRIAVESMNLDSQEGGRHAQAVQELPPLVANRPSYNIPADSMDQILPVASNTVLGAVGSEQGPPNDEPGDTVVAIEQSTNMTTVSADTAPAPRRRGCMGLLHLLCGPCLRCRKTPLTPEESQKAG